MDSTTETINGKKGQIVCRPSTWTDIILFFAFNYGLHVFTILSPPGSPPFQGLCTALASLLLPFSGILTALEVIYKRGTQVALGDLQIAHRAGALCMVIQGDQARYSRSGFVVSPDTNVHGQYPSTKKSSVPGDGNESAPVVICTLLRVPRTFTVNPPRNLGPTPFRLTYNYSILKAVAGIIQILSGSFGLYRVSQGQFLRLGYASYSLTVVPYILMSFVNLLATLCEPQYPSMFLVIYRGLELPPPLVADIFPAPGVGPTSLDDIAAVKSEPSAAPTPESDLLETLVLGAVGEAYGDLTQLDAHSAATPGVKSQFFVLGVLLLGVCCIAAPYIIIQLLTSYQAGHSTGSQRAWLMAWLVISQCYGVSFYFAGTDLMRTSDSTDSKLVLLCTIMLTGTASIGGFVVVGQMMTNDEICTVI